MYLKNLSLDDQGLSQLITDTLETAKPILKDAYAMDLETRTACDLKYSGSLDKVYALLKLPYIMNGLFESINVTERETSSIDVALNRISNDYTSANRFTNRLYITAISMTKYYDVVKTRARDRLPSGYTAENPRLEGLLMVDRYHKLTIISNHRNHIIVLTNDRQERIAFELAKAMFAAVPLIMPQLFLEQSTDTARCGADYIKYFETLAKDGVSAYISALFKGIDLEKIKADRDKKQLEQDTQRMLKRGLAKKQNEVRSLDNTLNDYYEKIARYQRDYDKARNELYGIEYASEVNLTESKEYEFMQYLRSNNNIAGYKLDDKKTTMDYIYITFARESVFVDSDYINMMINKSRLPGENDNYATPAGDTLRKMLRAIYVDEATKDRFGIRLYATFKILFSDYIVRYTKDYIYTDKGIIKDGELGIANPHLYHYNCTGSNLAVAMRNLKDNKLIDMLDQLSYCAAGLNVSDAPVFRSFLTDILLADRRNYKFIIDKETNSTLSVSQFMNCLASIERQAVPEALPLTDIDDIFI